MGMEEVVGVLVVGVAGLEGVVGLLLVGVGLCYGVYSTWEGCV